MRMSPVLSPQGQPVFTAGGGQAWKVAEHRGYVCSLEWIGQGRKAKPAMVIWSAGNVLQAGTESLGMWAILRTAVTEFVGFDANGRATGSISEHCRREALAAMPLLGKDPNDQQAHTALCDVVLKFAEQLVHMPVAPREVKEKVADLTPMWDVKASIKETGKVIHEGEV